MNSISQIELSTIYLVNLFSNEMSIDPSITIDNLLEKYGLESKDFFDFEFSVRKVNRYKNLNKLT